MVRYTVISQIPPIHLLLQIKLPKLIRQTPLYLPIPNPRIQTKNITRPPMMLDLHFGINYRVFLNDFRLVMNVFDAIGENFAGGVGVGI